MQVYLWVVPEARQIIQANEKIISIQKTETVKASERKSFVEKRRSLSMPLSLSRICGRVRDASSTLSKQLIICCSCEFKRQGHEAGNLFAEAGSAAPAATRRWLGVAIAIAITLRLRLLPLLPLLLSLFLSL